MFIKTNKILSKKKKIILFLKYKTKTTTFKSLVLFTVTTQGKFLKLKSRHKNTLIL